MALWDSVYRTDPKQTKPITGKSYSGTSPKPYHLIKRATETFGPCGIGWGFEIDRLEEIEGPGEEKLSVAQVRFWYVRDGVRGEVSHVGGTPLCGIRSSGKAFMDEDSYKKSVTDALVKAMSMVGFAGDIFDGRYDDSKYVAEAREEFAQEQAPSVPEAMTSKPAPRASVAETIKTIESFTDTASLIAFWKSEIVPLKDRMTENQQKRLSDAYATCGAALREKERKAQYQNEGANDD
jgi:hypothetical protein